LLHLGAHHTGIVGCLESRVAELDLGRASLEGRLATLEASAADAESELQSLRRRLRRSRRRLRRTRHRLDIARTWRGRLGLARRGSRT
jgi:chromosome segregation ATPase